MDFASVNPVDWKLMAAGRLPNPAIPGGDFAGEVVATGANVTAFGCGDSVAGIVNQRERGGSYAEYVTAPVSEIVAKPLPSRWQKQLPTRPCRSRRGAT